MMKYPIPSGRILQALFKAPPPSNPLPHDLGSERACVSFEHIILFWERTVLWVKSMPQVNLISDPDLIFFSTGWLGKLST
jgi:hypothetical protein